MELQHTLSSRALQYFVIGRHWASDLEFFKIEMDFFKRLLARKILSATDSNVIEHLRRADVQLQHLDAEVAATKAMLDVQLKHLELMAEDVIPEDTDELTGKQVKLEYLVTAITREYRELKKQIFVMMGEDAYVEREKVAKLN